MSYEALMDLEVSIREMIEYDIPSAEQWRAVEIFRKNKVYSSPVKIGVACYGAACSGLVVTELILIK